MAEEHTRVSVKNINGKIHLIREWQRIVRHVVQIPERVTYPPNNSIKSQVRFNLLHIWSKSTV